MMNNVHQNLICQNAKFYLTKILYRTVSFLIYTFLKTALNVFYTTISSLDADVHAIPDTYLFGHSQNFNCLQTT